MWAISNELYNIHIPNYIYIYIYIYIVDLKNLHLYFCLVFTFFCCAMTLSWLEGLDKTNLSCTGLWSCFVILFSVYHMWRVQKNCRKKKADKILNWKPDVAKRLMMKLKNLDHHHEPTIINYSVYTYRVCQNSHVGHTNVVLTSKCLCTTHGTNWQKRN